MTREERKAVSTLKKDLPKIVKPLIKPYGFRITSGRVWVRKDDMLYVMIPLINIKDAAVLLTTESLVADKPEPPAPAPAPSPDMGMY